jgi:hypothetical protein
MTQPAELGEIAREGRDARELGALMPLLQVFCCCLPLSAAMPGLSRRTRLMIVGGWTLMIGVGWALSAATS